MASRKRSPSIWYRKSNTPSFIISSENAEASGDSFYLETVCLVIKYQLILIGRDIDISFIEKCAVIFTCNLISQNC